ncbi:hypothetical protein [Streptosporangium sp. CA-115845]|uniref:hypothetical protein n=1 Tax=Streptosporangium sp. CA-115845 TaxID=3240071 RepID=UPI003D90E4CF
MSMALAAPAQNAAGPYGPLPAADANGIQLPAGFTGQVIARSGQVVSGTSCTWHSAPDGGACFADGSGWIYVSNSEIDPGGGASATLNPSSEITGPAFTSAGNRLYFSSRRGTSGSSSGGITYCVTGPFRT